MIALGIGTLLNDIQDACSTDFLVRHFLFHQSFELEAACLVNFLTWNSLYEVLALSACSVNSLTSLLTKSYDILYIIMRFLANRASYVFIHFKILQCLKIIRIEIRLCQAYLIDLSSFSWLNQVVFFKKKIKTSNS